MSRASKMPAAYREALIVQRIERHLHSLSIALARSEPRRFLDLYLEVCDLLVEQTGGTWVTASLRQQIAAARALVLAVPYGIEAGDVKGA